MNLEKWKHIKGYENLYMVSNLGRIKSLKRNNIMKNRIGATGYHTIGLYKNGVCKNKNIHRLVAEAFIPNPNSKPQVNHIDGIKTNNNIVNLEWVTASENGKHSYSIGLSRNWCEGLTSKDHPTSKAVVQISVDGEETVWLCAMDAVREFGFDSGSISHCCNGRYKTHKGFKWRYYDDRS